MKQATNKLVLRHSFLVMNIIIMVTCQSSYVVTTTIFFHYFLLQELLLYCQHISCVAQTFATSIITSMLLLHSIRCLLY